LKWALATDSAVAAGFSGDSGDRLRGDLGVVMMWTELARRCGATPLAEWSEFIEAFLSSVGVAERDGEWFEVEPFSGPRMALAGRGELGDRDTAGL
jgi:hypothetical protein